MPFNNKRPQLDIKALNKKYGFNVKQIIKHWKNNKKDAEITVELGVDPFKLACLRKDLEINKFNQEKLLSSIFWFDK